MTMKTTLKSAKMGARTMTLSLLFDDEADSD